jgi:hypothetical protein
MAAKARQMAKPRAVQDIADLIEGIALQGVGSTWSPQE